MNIKGSTQGERDRERKLIVFDKSKENPVINIIEYFLVNYERDENTNIDRNGDDRITSYRLLILAHNASGFDIWVILNSLLREKTGLKIIKMGKGWISLPFSCGVAIVNTVEVP